jgi:hypothetical protein
MRRFQEYGSFGVSALIEGYLTSSVGQRSLLARREFGGGRRGALAGACRLGIGKPSVETMVEVRDGAALVPGIERALDRRQCGLLRPCGSRHRTRDRDAEQRGNNY